MPDRLELLKGSIPTLRHQIQVVRTSIVANRAQLRATSNSILADARRQVAVEIGGLVSEHFFGRRRPGQRIVRVGVDENRRARRQQADEAAQSAARNVLEQVAAAFEEGLGDSVDWRLLRSLRSEVAKARSLQKPESILGRAESLLSVIDAYSPPGDDYSTIRLLDLRFRSFIREHLRAVGSDWWVSRVPPTVRVRAERSRGERGQASTDIVDFLSFGDYGKIILTDSNWLEIFSPVLNDRTRFQEGFRRLATLRNSIAHSRPLTSAERVEFRSLSSEVLAQLR